MWPVSGNWETRTPGQTVIKAAWGDAIDAALNGVIGGSKTIKAIYVDGIGYQPSALGDGIKVEVGGQLVMTVALGGITMENPAGVLNSTSNVEAAANVVALLGNLHAATGRSGAATPTTAVNAGEIYKDGTVLAWMRYDVGGGFRRGYNIQSVSHPSAGIFDVTLAAGVTNAGFLVPKVDLLVPAAVPPNIFVSQIDNTVAPPGQTSFRIKVIQIPNPIAVGNAVLTDPDGIFLTVTGGG